MDSDCSNLPSEPMSFVRTAKTMSGDTQKVVFSTLLWEYRCFKLITTFIWHSLSDINVIILIEGTLDLICNYVSNVY